LAQVNSLSRIISFIFWAILLGGIISLLRQRARSSARRAANARPSSPPKPVSLHRDPYCGTYVSPEVSIRATQAGQELHFCSAECRDRYLRSERQSASA
jgi:YHS domain-containing protein